VNRLVETEAKGGGRRAHSVALETPLPQVACIEAARVWDEHQADRAWIEWGFCWPPFSVRRPRCVRCAEAWPCLDALAADEHLAGCARHGFADTASRGPAGTHGRDELRG
jgi:hypothetical protein